MSAAATGPPVPPGRVIRWIVTGMALALGAATGAAAQHFPADEDLTMLLRYLVEDGETPGIVLGVLDPDGSTRAVGYGSGGPGSGPMGPASLFQIGTLTVTFTATLLADMVIRGEVALEDPVASYLPARVTLPTPGGYRITLGDLATHRSGLPPGPDDPAGIGVDDLYDLVATAELERPGVRYAFSPLGYGLLGHALARAAGQGFQDLLRERVLDPLGMDRTGYETGVGMDARTVSGHRRGSVVAHAPVTEAMQGGTGLWSTAEEMLRFLEANARPPETPLGGAVRMAQEIRVERGREDEDVGFGFSWRTYTLGEMPPIVSHGGAASGFTSMINFDPARGIGTVLLANTRAFNDRIGRTLLYFDPPSVRPVDVDPAVLREYAGTYRSDLGVYRAQLNRGRYYIRLEDEGFLTYQRRGMVRTRLYATSDSSFYMLREPLTLSFARQDDRIRLIIRLDERAPASRARSWRMWKVSDDAPSSVVVAGNAGFWHAWSPRTWGLVALLALLVALALRSLLAGRVGAIRGRGRAAWSRPGQYP